MAEAGRRRLLKAAIAAGVVGQLPACECLVRLGEITLVGLVQARAHMRIRERVGEPPEQLPSLGTERSQA